jgi:hypothetical protein
MFSQLYTDLTDRLVYQSRAITDRTVQHYTDLIDRLVVITLTMGLSSLNNF